MALLRPIPDYTATAKSSLYDALATSPQPSQPARPVRPGGHSSHATFIACLTAGGSLRGAARCAGLARPQAKEILRTFAKGAADCQATWAERSPAPGCRHVAACAFVEKDRRPEPQRADRSGAHAVWTHAWVEHGTGFIRRWLVGPSPALLTAGSRSPGAEPEAVRQWLGTLAPGLAKRIEQHAEAVSLFAVHHNFCSISEGNRTPAMRSGIAERAWTADDLESLAFSREGAS